ncbi:transcriptional regulator, LuxR family [Paenibacillus sp. oral taxon 786 str. D14]|uniref:helix-turn-helix transcriptional regulator n=1 Tax=unclassified Paenibacillus TaxID=185978 RepID=UPI0001AFD248|nr:MULTISPECIES: LuxR family transcriptional regulator [unclassified Paenibacillus]EES74119.1 transcriptional regulator, LuxR family [Paenibacillus sp. oral taxon 786 str. D14]MCT2196745.1 LuxR family transcriptional regulator [Paenibacillus sp. p3-SID1389]
MRLTQHEHQDPGWPSRIVGREWELEVFSLYLKHYSSMERIINIYGSSGVGKSSLAEEFQKQAAKQGAAVITLDAAKIKTTPEEICRQILFQLGLLDTLPSLSDPDFIIRAAIEAVNKRANLGAVLLFIDTYELLETMDDWFRDFFIPQIKDRCLSIITGRNPLSSKWTGCPLWKYTIYRMPLKNLDYHSVVAFLRGRGIVEPDQIQRIWKQTDGLPVMLTSLLGEHNANDGEPALPGLRDEARPRGCEAMVLDGSPAPESLPKLKPEAAIYARTDLTHREKEVAALASEGLTNRDIASRLFLSEVTIKKHMRSIFQKVGASNRTQLLKLLISVPTGSK